MIYFCTAVMRLLWYALNPIKGSGTMPEGWLQERMGAISSLISEHECGAVEIVLDSLFAGDTGGFATWINQRTKSFVDYVDAKMLETDLESVIEFMELKASRTIPCNSLSQGASNKQKLFENLLLFVDGP
jgi:hypothetical protein